MRADAETVSGGSGAETSFWSNVRADVSWKGLALAAPLAARDMSYALATLLAALLAFFVVRWGFRADAIGFDFEGTLWEPGVAIREGRSPYPAPVASEVDVGNPALYPPLLMVLIAPLTVLPWSVGVTVWTVLVGTALAASLFILDVRDVRCYVLALISAPATSGLVWGNATLLLVPLVALAWRWREHWLRTGVLVGLAIGSKLFLWPLLLWLLGTRRYRAFGAAVVVACVAVLAPWAVIGFVGLSSYPDLLRVAEEVYAVHGYSFATMLSALGADTPLASRSALALGLAIAAIAFVAGRRSRDEISLSLAVLAAILGSPIVWEYYYVLLFVPLAIARPRFSGLWVVLTLFYLTHRLPRPRLLASDLEVGGIACCRPDDIPQASWVFNHAPPGLWPAAGHAALAAVLTTVVAWSTLRATGRRLQ